MDAVCVYCGSSPGDRPEYLDAAREMGRTLAERDLTLVYGGGSVGMMGAVADAVLDHGGEAVGVIPEALDAREVTHQELSDLRVVDSMHERKQTMADLADGFAALPGGLGTLEEICEILTWAQLGIHRDPCGFLAVEDYFDDLVSFFDHATAQGFVSEDHRDLVLVADDPDDLLDRFEAYEPPEVPRWLDESET
ncbi:TIGR00730 family Rossman fold protein [Halospeciosus flavus]|uniref:TIGR00730 family Rossman fold protein n=1 Tax=Halospeciosus flavus TaxID=3032283 RepID=A0ABD5Z4E5_9EURY|nr:TIGR00730 family Rossman fold protein [Halospeciosus flavus]